MKTDTSIHRVELKHARDDIIRHKPVEIDLWVCQDDIGYLSIKWEFIHTNITMFTVHRPMTELEQALRDARAWSRIDHNDSTERWTPISGEAYTNEEE